MAYLDTASMSMGSSYLIHRLCSHILNIAPEGYTMPYHRETVLEHAPAADLLILCPAALAQLMSVYHAQP